MAATGRTREGACNRKPGNQCHLGTRWNSLGRHTRIDVYTNGLTQDCGNSRALCQYKDCLSCIKIPINKYKTVVRHSYISIYWESLYWLDGIFILIFWYGALAVELQQSCTNPSIIRICIHIELCTRLCCILCCCGHSIDSCGSSWNIYWYLLFISRSLKATRFWLKCFQSLWNLTGTSETVLPRCPWNFRAIRSL